MIITITGSSGTGKTVIGEKLTELRPDIARVISLTTRSPRPSDPPGEYRYHVSLEEFEARKEEFLWVTPVTHGNRYGTLKQSVDEAFGASNPSLMLLVPESVRLLRKYAGVRYGCVMSFYILSPPREELEKRLVIRGEADSNLEKRIKECEFWDTEAKQSLIPYIFLKNNEPTIGIEKAARQILRYCCLSTSL